MVYLIATIILLGVLIFIHELGHFLVARACGVRVEVFSLGFGPKVLKKKVGDTVYCISAIPLGGYVKMYGDELDKEVPKDEQRFGYLSQPIPRKMAIAFAGPLFNLLFTVVVFALLAFLGRERLEPKLGSIFPGTPAYEAGLRTADIITTVDGKSVKFGDDVEDALKSTAAKGTAAPTAHLEIIRSDTAPDTIQGDTQTLTIEVPLSKQFGPNEYGQIQEEAFVPGMDFTIHLPEVDVIGKNRWAHTAGLQDKDLITHINGQAVSSLDHILPLLQSALESNRAVEITVKRLSEQTSTPAGITCVHGGSCEDVVLTAVFPSSLRSSILRGAPALDDFGLAPAELSISKVKAYSGAEKADVRGKDVILSADGISLTHFEAFRKLIQKHGQDKTAMTLVLDRNGETITTEVVPEPLSEEDSEQPWTVRNYPFAIGIYPYISITYTMVLHRITNPFSAMAAGATRTVEWSKRFCVGIWKLIVGDISSKMLSGPIYIGKMAGDMMQAGLRQFLFLMAIISLNLGLINLLPIPVLDGGHIMMFTIEAILRRKPSVRVMERAFQVGLVFIILLSLFAIYNDLLRVLK